MLFPEIKFEIQQRFRWIRKQEKVLILYMLYCFNKLDYCFYCFDLKYHLCVNFYLQTIAEHMKKHGVYINKTMTLNGVQ